MQATEAPATEFLSDDFREAAEVAPIIADRSTLERWSTCPQQAAQVDRKLVATGGEAATVGNEVHRLFAEAVKARRVNGALPHELRDMLTIGAMQSRPDVQPAVIDAVKYATWKFVEIITTLPESSEPRAPEDLLRFDGGEGEQSGQLAADLVVDGTTVRLTCEVDLLMATVSVEELELIDHKAGRKHWTATAVRSSFQFQFYAYLLLRNYPTAQRITIRIFMPALSDTTAAVTIHRKDMFAIEQRIKAAASLSLMYHDTPIAEIPTWPELYKCSICDAVRNCPSAAEPATKEPEGVLKHLVVLEAAATSCREILKEMVRDGGDLVYGAGTTDAIAFGTGKPKSSRAPTCDLYTPAGIAPAANSDLPVKVTARRSRKQTVSEITVDIEPTSPALTASEPASLPAPASEQTPAASPKVEPAPIPRPAPESQPVTPAVNVEAPCKQPWPDFLRDWHELVKASVAQSDFARAVGKLVLAIQKKHKEETISRGMRQRWVAASLENRINWMTGRISETAVPL